MSYQVERLKHFFREQVRNNPQLDGVDPDRLTLTALALNLQTRFYEGYFGEKRVREAMREGAELQRKDPEGYRRALENYSPYHAELRTMGIRNVLITETLVSSNLAYAIGTLRDAERLDNRPAFQTDLYDLVARRTRDNLRPIKTQAGVTLANRLLAVRAENTTHLETSWVTQGEQYTMVNFERGVELTWEAILNDDFDEYGDVIYQLGEAAARTRAWAILDAARRSANFLKLPSGGTGPTMDNIETAISYMAQQNVNGATYSRNLTDIYIPGTWRSTAQRATNTNAVVVVGGSAGDVQRINPTNLAAGVASHVEEIMAELPVDDVAFPGQSNLDWIAADPSKKPIEFSVLSLFAAGPRILTRLPNVVELDSMGSFAEHVIATKITDMYGAEVKDKTALLLVSGKNAV